MLSRRVFRDTGTTGLCCWEQPPKGHRSRSTRRFWNRSKPRSRVARLEPAHRRWVDVGQGSQM